MVISRALNSPVFIVGAKRTPFGTFGGTLRDLTCTDLCVTAAKSALASANVDPTAVNTVVVGNVSQTSGDTAYLARHVGLRSGVPIPVPALTLNRLCGSGFQALISGTQEILLGDAQIALTGGAESMSQAPYVLRNVRFGTRVGSDLTQKDSLFETLTDSFCGTPMAITAENLATQYGISREECDAYALSSQQRWAQSHEAGIFEAELAPITLQTRKGEKVFSADEHPRPQSTPEALAKLPAVFKKGGVVTAGNASGISDGAGAIVLAGAEAVKTMGLSPLARVVGYAIAGVEPTVMGIGPVPAIRAVLKSTGLSLSDLDLVEVNEAFAAQYLAVERELGLDRSRTNVNGGAIALGHPTGASGSRIMAHLAHRLQATGGKYALGSACIGGGQGIAVVIERA